MILVWADLAKSVRVYHYYPARATDNSHTDSPFKDKSIVDVMRYMNVRGGAGENFYHRQYEVTRYHPTRRALISKPLCMSILSVNVQRKGNGTSEHVWRLLGARSSPQISYKAIRCKLGAWAPFNDGAGPHPV